MTSEAFLDYGISLSRAFFKYYYYIYIILLVFVLVTLSVVGGLVFQIVESPPEAKIIDAIMRQRDSTIRQLRVKVQGGENKNEITLFIQLYEGQYIGAIRNGTVILNGKQDPLWTFEGSVYYCVTTFSLVGYGNLAPRTNLGRAIAIIYCGFTIPVNSLILAELGEMLLLAFEYIWIKVSPRKSAENPPAQVPTINFSNANENNCSNYRLAIRCPEVTAEADCQVSGGSWCPGGNHDATAARSRPGIIWCYRLHRVADRPLRHPHRSDSIIALGGPTANVDSTPADGDSTPPDGDFIADGDSIVDGSSAADDDSTTADDDSTTADDDSTADGDFVTAHGDSATADDFNDVFNDVTIQGPRDMSVSIDNSSYKALRRNIGKTPNFVRMDICMCVVADTVVDRFAIADTRGALRDSSINHSVDAVCDSSCNVRDDSLIDFDKNVLYDSAIDFPKNVLGDVLTDSPKKVLGDSLMNSPSNVLGGGITEAAKKTFRDDLVATGGNNGKIHSRWNKYVLCNRSNKVIRLEIEVSAMFKQKRDQMLTKAACYYISSSELYLEFKKCTSHHAQQRRIMLASGDISESRPCCDNSGTDGTCSYCQHGNAAEHNTPCKKVDNRHHVQDNRAGNTIQSVLVVKCNCATWTRLTRSLKPLMYTDMGDRPRQISARQAIEARSWRGKESQTLQAQTRVVILTRCCWWWALPVTDHTKPLGRMCVDKKKADYALDGNYLLTCRHSRRRKMYPAVTCKADSLFCINGQERSGTIQIQRYLVRWRSVSEVTTRLVKMSLCPIRNSVAESVIGQRKEGMSIRIVYICRECRGQVNVVVCLANEHTSLTIIVKFLHGHCLPVFALSQILDYSSKPVLGRRLSPAILFLPGYFSMSLPLRTCGFENHRPLVPDNGVPVRSCRDHAVLVQNTIVEAARVAPVITPYIKRCLGTAAKTQALLRGCASTTIHSCTDRKSTHIYRHKCTIESPSKKCQSTHESLRYSKSARGSMPTMPPSSGTHKHIHQAAMKDTKGVETRAYQQVLARVKSVAKFLLEREVRMPDPVTMFWLGTPLRGMYIGKRVGSGILKHLRNVGGRRSSRTVTTPGESTSRATGQDRRIAQDRNNNEESDDSDSEEENVEDLKRDAEEAEARKVTSEPVLLTIATTFMFISLGSTFLTKFADNMTYFDSYWFIWISVATIGYGDIVPTEQRLFLGILAYLFIGLCLMSNLISETSLFFSANVTKTRAITSDAVAIINTRKQLILIQRRAEKANEHWAILRDRVLNKKIPRHLVEESMKYKAGLMAEERELVRWAYKIYFKQEPKPVYIFQSPYEASVPKAPTPKLVPERRQIKPIEFELEPKPQWKPSLFQRIKRSTANSFRRVKNKLKRKPKVTKEEEQPINQVLRPEAQPKEESQANEELSSAADEETKSSFVET